MRSEGYQLQFPLRVLLVDDEEDHYVWTRRLLSSASDARLDWASTYDEALPAIRDRQHDVILIDYRLRDDGGRDGLDLVRHAQKEKPGTPCILLSAAPCDRLEVDSLSAGAAAYLSKAEISPSLLMHVLRYALERAQAERQLQAKNRALELILRATAMANEAASAGDAFEGCLREVCAALGWECSAALAVTASGDEVTPMTVYTGEAARGAALQRVLAGARQPRAEPLSTLLQTRRWVFCSDLAHCGEPRYRELFQLGMRSTLLLPVAAHGELAGVLELHSAAKRPREAWGLEVLTSTAVQLAQAALRERAEIERKGVEEDLRRSQRLDALGRLAGGVAHDFNNLLTIITATSDLLLRRAPGDRDDGPIQTMRDAAVRGAQLTRQLLALGRRSVLQPRIVAVNDVIGGAESLLRRTLREDIDFRLSLACDAGCIEVDPSAFEQVLLNLVINARDAIDGAGVLTIATRRDVVRRPTAAEQPCVRVTVSDTGVGMSPETLHHVFDPFFTTKSPQRGTGLGLSSVYGIVKHAGGTIEVESEPGQGAAFHLHFPLREETSPPPISSRPPQGAACGGDETVLLVEDDEGVRATTALVLRSYGYRVLSAAHPQEALELACRANAVDLVLSDVVMPGKSGVAFAAELQALSPQTAVLFMSGYAQGTAEEEGVVDAAHRLVRKPFTPEDLAARVRKSIDRAKERGASATRTRATEA